MRKKEREDINGRKKMIVKFQARRKEMVIVRNHKHKMFDFFFLGVILIEHSKTVE